MRHLRYIFIVALIAAVAASCDNNDQPIIIGGDDNDKWEQGAVYEGTLIKDENTQISDTTIAWEYIPYDGSYELHIQMPNEQIWLTTLSGRVDNGTVALQGEDVAMRIEYNGPIVEESTALSVNAIITADTMSLDITTATQTWRFTGKRQIPKIE